MKLTALAFISLLASGTVAHADNYNHTEPFHFTHALDADGTVSVENVNGEIKVLTWDKNEILIEGTKRAKTEEELELIELEIDLTDSNASIRARLPKRPDGGWFGGGNVRGSVDFKVTVPESVTLRNVKTVNGSVLIEGVRGSVVASSVNGPVEANGLGADARMETVNGPVRASFAAVPAGADLEFKSVNGPVVVRLPEDLGAVVDASVVNGDIHTDFPLTLTGKVSRKHLKGEIGDGRASLSLRTVNGAIKLNAGN